MYEVYGCNGKKQRLTDCAPQAHYLGQYLYCMYISFDYQFPVSRDTMNAILTLGCAQTAIRLGLSSLALTLTLALALLALPAWLLYICCSRSLHPHQCNSRQIFLGQPRLLPTQVSHTRLGTGRYNYTVPHFLVGTPVGLQGHVGRVLSVDEPESRTQTAGLMQYLSPNLASWFTVHAHHHLHKGNDARGLQGKLHDFLVSQVGPILFQFQFLIPVAAPPLHSLLQLP